MMPTVRTTGGGSVPRRKRGILPRQDHSRIFVVIHIVPASAGTRYHDEQPQEKYGPATENQREGVERTNPPLNVALIKGWAAETDIDRPYLAGQADNAQLQHSTIKGAAQGIFGQVFAGDEGDGDFEKAFFIRKTIDFDRRGFQEKLIQFHHAAASLSRCG